MCECVAVSVGVVCQAWVEAMMGKIQLGGPRGCQYKYNFLVLFFFWKMKFPPKIRARTGVEGEAPTHKTERGPHSSSWYLHNLRWGVP